MKYSGKQFFTMKIFYRVILNRQRLMNACLVGTDAPLSPNQILFVRPHPLFQYGYKFKTYVLVL